MTNAKLHDERPSQALECWNYVFLSLCFILCIPNLASAQSENKVINIENPDLTSNTQPAKDECACRPNEDAQKKDLDHQHYHFRPYQPNSAVWQYTDGDQHSAEVNYSFMYLVSSPDKYDLKCDDCLGVYFSYTGRFDFYMGTRPSGPVVNRISNPALHFRWFDNEMMGLDWLDVAIEHKSNGQVVSANEPVAPNSALYRAAVEYAAGNHQYLDSISRSSNYLSIEGHTTYTSTSNKKTNYYLKIFTFRFEEESDVYWGKYAAQKVGFSDFEKVKVVVLGNLGDLSTRKDLQKEYGVEWTVGDKWLATDSINIWVKLPVPLPDNGALPVTIRTHFGPMNELSNYTESQRSIGLGLAFFY